MAQRKENKERPTGNREPREQTTVDAGTDSTMERVKMLVAGAEESTDIEEGGIGEKLAELEVTTEEEVDALKNNLLQEDERPDSTDGSGLVIDEAAEEQLARFTESDPREGDLGARSVEPGRDNTSAVLRRHHPNTSIARSDAVVEGNLDEPRDEIITERKVDEGTSG